VRRLLGPAPPASDATTLSRMVKQRRHDTQCEMRIRRALHKAGLRYRLHCRPEANFRRRADIVFRTAKVTVFVDGCFWHGCPLHWKIPRRNAAWWTEKINANVARDSHTTATLQAGGWCVIRIWEHEDAEKAAARVARIVRRRLSRRRRK
jgi:DNA mismatch endonuclease, patch repair protein